MATRVVQTTISDELTTTKRFSCSVETDGSIL